MNRTWHVDPWHGQSVWAIDLVKLMLTHIDLQDIVPVHFCSCGQCLKVFLKSFVWSLPSIWVFPPFWKLIVINQSWHCPLFGDRSPWSGTKPYENSPWKDTTNSPQYQGSNRSRRTTSYSTSHCFKSESAAPGFSYMYMYKCLVTFVYFRQGHQISVPFPWSDPWTLSLYDSSTAVFLNVAETAVGCSTCVSISHVY